jgi:hypothetical protein
MCPHHLTPSSLRITMISHSRHQDLGDHAAALECFREALALRTRHLGPRAEATALVLENTGTLLLVSIVCYGQNILDIRSCRGCCTRS